ncbi:isochorismatase [Bacillus thuringiensis]|uniref:isochorismatase family protein n=1 Tax=Bacillus thuringiensis TaxID=1428 RepID=UPI000BF324ED|nr:isochorismatase family protein [Bacillus thuringiensis]PEZ46368.1 isochorismatase [Bacillus thuringiensis]PGY56656.1 isochorismatase [Bacillus thuringiensis]
MDKLSLDFQKTVLLLIDLQKGIVPIPGGKEVVEKASMLIQQFRKNNGFIGFVCVDFHDGLDYLIPITDTPVRKTNRSKDWAEFVPELGVLKEDYKVIKRQWGAFFGTDLDLQLRRRGIDTIVLCGIATNIGVESTAREAFQLGYQQIFITDAMASFTQEEHEASCSYIFPKIGRIRNAQDLLLSVKENSKDENE